MNKFNLTFSGEILAGHDPAQVRLRFARKFAIEDPIRLERFFGGETITLRRNLERKAAAQLYHELHQIGAIATLVKITDSEADTANAVPKQTTPANSSGTAVRPNEPRRPTRPSASEQTWAVSSAARKSKAKGKAQGRPGRTPAKSQGASAPAAWKRDTVDIAAGIKARKLASQRQGAGDEARERAALAEQQRSATETTARKEAEAVQRQRLAEEEAARLEADSKRLAEEEATRQEAERKRLAEEEAARQEAERKRLTEEEAVRQEAERTRLAEEEAASQAVEAARRAAEEESRRKAAEEASRRETERKRQKAEQDQRKAKAAAARKAQQAEKRRRDAEEKARRKAVLEEKKRQEAAEAARRKAALEEQKRREAEEAARHKAALQEKQRLEAAETARRAAELEEQKRREAEEERRQAELEAHKRIAAEEAARQKAELEELQRREAEEDARLQAELAAIELREAEEARRLQAELEEQARQAAAQTARIREEAQQQQQEAQRKSAERRRAITEALAARQARQAAKRRESGEPQAQRTELQSAQPPRVSHTVARDLPRTSPDRRTKPRIRTALEIPPRNLHRDTPAPAQRKRQPGEPNVYKLRPFRNSEEVRARATLAQRRARHSYTLGIAALAALLIVMGSFMQRTLAPTIPGARAVAVDPRSGPMLLAHDALLFHDRAGIGTGVQPLRTLGLAALDPPLAFDDNGAFMAVGRLDGDQANPSAGGASQLLRCEIVLAQCTPFSPQLADNRIDAFAINPVDGNLLLADRSAGLLLKADREGTIVARADMAFAEHLVLRLHSGLLLMNSATAPAISVLRYENNAFGQQLDEILLLPPGVEGLEALRVDDFLWSGDAWWVSLHHPGTGHAGLFRFDEEWNFLDRVDLPAGGGKRQLVNWGEKVLANDPQHIAIQRISALGVVETPFVSSQLEGVSAEQQRRTRLTNLAWRGALLMCALVAALGLGLGYLQSRRALVYQPRREQGAEPLEEHIDTLRWIDPVADRQALLQRRMTSYAVLALGVLLLAVARSVSVWQLAALLLALSGPAVALLLLSRRAIGHIGLAGDRLLLVDHNGTYHLAGGSRVQYRGPFLTIDDVIVYCGGRFLPAFSPLQIQQLIRPLALGGIKVDRDTMTVKLLQSRHPLALGVIVIVAAISVATIVLYLQDIA